MNTKSSSSTDSDQKYFDSLIASGEINVPDYGVITDGLCATAEAQSEFDMLQKNVAPLL